MSVDADILGRPQKRTWKAFKFTLAAILLLPVAVCAEPLLNWSAHRLPRGIGTDATLASDSQIGLGEGCEAAIYRLSESTSRDLATDGIAYLDRAGRPENDNARNRFGPWQKTPGEIDLANNGFAKNTIYGLYALRGCDNRNDKFDRTELIHALSSPGSYYTVTANREGIIFVSPQSRLAAYFYVG